MWFDMIGGLIWGYMFLDITMRYDKSCTITHYPPLSSTLTQSKKYQ